MKELTSTEPSKDLELYLGNTDMYPLLTAEQERDADLRKWASARACLRLLVNDAAGRELLMQFCEACLCHPPRVEMFASRSGFFHLRKDIAELLPQGTRTATVAALLELMRQSASSQEVMRALHAAAWPATLIVGLAVVEMRALGSDFSDTTADSLVVWIKPWRTRRRSPDRRLASRLRFAVLRYLASRDRLVLHNVRLAYKLARENQNRSVALRDLVQEGCAGLVRAAEKFDYRRGFRFSTYAFNWINQFILRACEGNGSLIAYPAHVHQEINTLHRLRMQHLELTGTEPGLEQLAEMSAMKLEKVRSLRQLTNLTLPLDQPASEASELTLANTLADPDSDRSVNFAAERMLARLMDERLGQLEEIEQRVVRGRFGLQGHPQLTFAQLADQLDISREWVRQLEKSALGKLRLDPALEGVYEELEA